MSGSRSGYTTGRVLYIWVEHCAGMAVGNAGRKMEAVMGDRHGYIIAYSFS